MKITRRNVFFYYYPIFVVENVDKGLENGEGK